jgi:hypothetical protein
MGASRAAALPIRRAAVRTATHCRLLPYVYDLHGLINSSGASMKVDLGRKNRTQHACMVRLSRQVRKVPVGDSGEVWKILALGSLLGICVPSFLFIWWKVGTNFARKGIWDHVPKRRRIERRFRDAQFLTTQVCLNGKR